LPSLKKNDQEIAQDSKIPGYATGSTTKFYTQHNISKGFQSSTPQIRSTQMFQARRKSKRKATDTKQFISVKT